MTEAPEYASTTKKCPRIPLNERHSRKTNRALSAPQLAASVPRWLGETAKRVPASSCQRKSFSVTQSLLFSLSGVFNLWLRLAAPALPLLLDGKEDPRYGRRSLVQERPNPTEPLPQHRPQHTCSSIPLDEAVQRCHPHAYTAWGV